MGIPGGLPKQIKGFLDEAEGMRLYEIAKAASLLGPCLEIGSYCGKSTAHIGAACLENDGMLWTIDHHRGSEEQQPGEEYFDPGLFDHRTGKVDTFAEFRKTLEKTGLENTVVPIVCKSEVAARSWSTPLGMVFIDGGHSFAAAFSDYNAWSGHIVQGGFLAIHDIYKDPQKGGQAPYHVYKFALGSGLYTELPMTGTLGVLRRLRCSEIPKTE